MQEPAKHVAPDGKAFGGGLNAVEQIYNGEPEWKAADSVIALIPPAPEPHLRPWLPTHRTYLLIDEVRLARQFGSALLDNLAELFMRIEASPDGESVPRLIRHLVTLLACEPTLGRSAAPAAMWPTSSARSSSASSRAMHADRCPRT